MDEKLKKTRRRIDAGSIVSAAGLVIYFLCRGAGLPLPVCAALAGADGLLSLAVLLSMIACRQDGGKNAISGNRLTGQGALTALSLLALAAVLKECGIELF